MSSVSDKNDLAQTVEETAAALHNARQEIDSLRYMVASLQYQLAYREQENMRNDLEITGVPELPNEDLLHIVLIAAQKVGVDLVPADVNEVIRVGPKQRKDTTGPKMTRPIVAKLVRKLKRDELLRAARCRRYVTTENMINCHPVLIFFNERLTKENRHLYQHACYRIREYEYRFCWVRNGSIYVRKADGAPVIRIATMADLDHKIGPLKLYQVASTSTV